MNKSTFAGFVLAAVSISCSGKKATEEKIPAIGMGSAQGSASGSAPAPAPVKEYKLAWSTTLGSLPFKLIDAKGLLKKRAEENGVKITLENKPYKDAVAAFSAGSIDAVTISALDAIQTAVDPVAIVITDSSNGHDGLVVRGIADLKALKGKEILVAEKTPSHYLLARGLETAGLKDTDVKIKNTDGDEAGKQFIADKKIAAAVTWNPHLIRATDGKVIYSSKDIPGEMLSLVVVNGKALAEQPKLGKAIAEAWYDAMKLIEDPASREEAIKLATETLGVTADEFMKMMPASDLRVSRAKAAAELDDPKTKATIEKLKKFAGVTTDKLKFDSQFAK